MSGSARRARGLARPARRGGFFAFILVALLFAQWSGWTHRIEHAPRTIPDLVALSSGHESRSMRDHGSGTHAAQHHHDHAAAKIDTAPHGTHSCVLFDAVALGDGPPAQAAVALRPPAPCAAQSAPLAARRALDCPAFAAARAPPSALS